MIIRTCFLLTLFFFSPSIWACRVAFPSENRCESGQKVTVSLGLLHNLKKSIEAYYGKRDRFITAREKTMTSQQKKKWSPSSCFNLRHAEMYVNYLIQMNERSSRLCRDHLQRLVLAVDQMISSDSEENRFVLNKKQKIELIDLSMDVSTFSEAIKMETMAL
jgi:hypothetical protein